MEAAEPMPSPSPRRPEDFSSRVLLLVAGLSPQVVTETVYALAVARDPPFIPTAVRLLATQESAERARLMLLSDEPGWFARLIDDYDLPPIPFGEGDIHVLCDPAGLPIEDIRTERDNMYAANAITEWVRRETADPETALHVSISGGRKTMGYYAGYALSLFGRPQDRLSHVLVSPSFEANPGFFYPSPHSRIIYTPPPDSRPLDAKDARVTLAEIPFVRLRQGLPEALLAGEAGFQAVVRAAQSAVAPPELAIDPANGRISAGGVVIRLPPVETAFLVWMARRRIRGEAPLPCPPEGTPSLAYAKEFLAVYREAAKDRRDLERTERALRRGMDKGYFESHKSKLNRRLRRALGPNAAVYAIQAFGNRPHTRFGLGIAGESIRFGNVEDQDDKLPIAQRLSNPC